MSAVYEDRMMRPAFNVSGRFDNAASELAALLRGVAHDMRRLSSEQRARAQELARLAGIELLPHHSRR